MQQKIQHVVNTGLDATSLGIVVGTIFDMLPPVAALVSIVWLGINIYERVTGKKLSDMYKDWKDKKGK